MTDIQLIRQTRKQFTIEYPEGTDFSGKTPEIEYKKISTNEVILTHTTSNGLTVVDNIITVDISTTQSNLFVDKRYRADLAFKEGIEIDRTPPFYLSVSNYVTDALA